MTETEQEYFQICAWRKLHPLPQNERGEIHHILPHSCGGFDRPFNLVKLTIAEHLRCHELLPIIFKERQWHKEYKSMICARYFMRVRNGIEQCVKDKEEWRNIMSEKISIGLMGHEVSEESRRRMAVHAYGNKNMLGHKHTAESRKKMSEAKKGKHPWNYGKKKKRTNILVG